MTRVALVFAVGIVAWIGTALVLLNAQSALAWWMPPLKTAPWVISLYVVVQLAVPTGLAAAVMRRCARLWLGGSRCSVAGRWLHWARWPLVVSYMLTMAFGCPAVESALTEGVLTAVNSAPYEWERHRSRTYAAVSVLPGLVLAYHEGSVTYHPGGAMGGGGFHLYLWNGNSVVRLASHPLWIIRGGPTTR